VNARAGGECGCRAPRRPVAWHRAAEQRARQASSVWSMIAKNPPLRKQGRVFRTRSCTTRHNVEDWQDFSPEKSHSPVVNPAAASPPCLCTPACGANSPYRPPRLSSGLPGQHRKIHHLNNWLRHGAWHPFQILIFRVGWNLTRTAGFLIQSAGIPAGASGRQLT
jgi:hypothetical protein